MFSKDGEEREKYVKVAHVGRLTLLCGRTFREEQQKLTGEGLDHLEVLDARNENFQHFKPAASDSVFYLCF